MNKSKNKRAILIDGNNIAYRAFYAIPETVSTSSGIATNAVLGFTNMLLKLIEEENPDTIVCAFDSKKPTFRHEMFDQYKIKRKKMPSSLAEQFPLIKEVLSAFNIVCMEKDGFEADDILADLAGSLKDKFEKIIIVTGDKDILQLVSGNVKVMALKKGITETVLFDGAGVREKFGVEPDYIKDLLALMGDSSDNIPGVPGIGPGTAKMLVNRYGAVENIYENLGKIESKHIRELLSENKKLAEMSKELATLKKAGDINTEEIIKNSFKNISISRVRQLFQSLEFKNPGKRLNRLKDKIDFKEEDDNSSKNAEIMDEIELKYLAREPGIEIKELKAGDRIYTAVWEHDKKFFGIILYYGEKRAYLIEKKDLENDSVKNSLGKILGDKENKISGFDFKKIYKILKKYGINTGGKFFDYKIMYLILNPVKSNVTMDEILYDLLQVEPEIMERKIEGSINNEERNLLIPENIDKKKQLELDFCRRDEEEIRLAGYELDIVVKKMSLYRKIEEKLLKRIKEEEMEELYWKIEEPLIKVLAEMEYKGVNIDKKYLNGLITEYERDIENLTKEIYELCGEEFNINSSKQLSDVLYNKLGLPAVKKTKTGLSTDAGTLKTIYNSSPVIKKILDYREKAKLKNTYIDVLPGLVDIEDSRVHTTYNQLGTSTGRISSSDPNLQNIPVRTEYGRQIRKAFIPGVGYDLVMASDYSQIELRILAHLSGDKILIDSFKREEDIHARTASELFEVDYDSVTEDLRRKAKAINFGIIYGMTEYGLMNRLSISEDEAREYIKKYFDKYPDVKKYIRSLISEAYEKGYSKTIFGRKRYLRELGSSNNKLRSLGERFAVNTPIQGSAADIMKLSTVVLFDKLKSEKIDSNIILHVHDELVLELKEKDSEVAEKAVRESMENCIKLKVNLKVDIKYGRNWYM